MLAHKCWLRFIQVPFTMTSFYSSIIDWCTLHFLFSFFFGEWWFCFPCLSLSLYSSWSPMLHYQLQERLCSECDIEVGQLWLTDCFFSEHLWMISCPSVQSTRPSPHTPTGLRKYSGSERDVSILISYFYCSTVRLAKDPGCVCKTKSIILHHIPEKSTHYIEGWKVIKISFYKNCMQTQHPMDQCSTKLI